MTEQIFQHNLDEHIELLKKMSDMQAGVLNASEIIRTALIDGKTVFFCGNGGSAADAQHIAAELSGRYLKDRKALNGVALHCNTSAVTAIANDFGFEHIYARQIEAQGRAGDVLVAISTSGNSANILHAIEAARAAGIGVIGMTGASGGKMASLCDVLLAVPSASTPRIQEMHIFLGHVLCEIVESVF